MTAAALALDNLSKQFGTHTAVDAVTLDVQRGELIVLLGPSGCGKTMTLRMIAGFVPPSAGDIQLDGASIVGVPPHRREMGIVFQSYALFPHLTVARNVAFGLEMRRMATDAAQARVAEMLRPVKLEAFAQRRSLRKPRAHRIQGRSRPPPGTQSSRQRSRHGLPRAALSAARSRFSSAARRSGLAFIFSTSAGPNLHHAQTERHAHHHRRLLLRARHLADANHLWHRRVRSHGTSSRSAPSPGTRHVTGS